MKFYTDVCLLGNKIGLRGFENGKRFTRRVEFEPSLFLETDIPSQYKSLYEKLNLEKMDMSIKDYRNYIRDYNDMLEIHGSIQPEFQYISKNYGVNCEYDIAKIRIATIDIETAVGQEFPDPIRSDQELTLITVGIRGDRKYSFGCGDYKPKDPNNYYFKFKNEVEMIEGFMKFWSSDYPDIITSWNGDSFDMPYLYNRFKNQIDEKFARKLSPWKRCWVKEVEGKYGSQELRVKIYGIQQLDLLSLYKKNILAPRDNYKLDTIAEVELGRGKIDYSDVGSLHKLYLTDFQRYGEYNDEDVQLVEDIDEKQRLVEFTVMMAYKFGINYEDVAYQVRCWDSLIYNTLKKDNIQIPPKRDNEFVRKYAGAYVKDPILGMHDWVVSYDLSSLYPSIMKQLNISPEKMRKFYDGYYIDQGVKRFMDGDIPNEIFADNVTISCNGQTFSKDEQGFLPKILAELGIERTNYKEEMKKYEKLSLSEGITDQERENYETLKDKFDMFQKSVKVALNSAYGALGNLYGRYYSLEMAEAITLFGQMVIKETERDVNNRLNEIFKTKDIDYCVCVDTDSVVGETMIYVDGKKISIEDYYNSLDTEFIKKDNFNKNYIKKGRGKSLSYSNNNKVEENNILYCMKHKVKKNMYKIKSMGKEVILTEDHSIIVKNKQGDIISISPKNLCNKKHTIINIIYDDTDSKAQK